MSRINLSKQLKTRIAIISGASLLLLGGSTTAIIAGIEANKPVEGVYELVLNDRRAVINDPELRIQPGDSITKTLFVENKSNKEVYYTIFLEDIKGELANYIDIKISRMDTVLYQGKPNELTEDKVEIKDEILKVDEKRMLSMTFTLDGETTKNDAQGKTFDFVLAAQLIRPDELNG